MRLQPLTDHLLIKAFKQEKTDSGIILPEEAQPKGKGEVVASGPGRVLDNGQRLEMSVKVGDKIIFREFAGDKIKEGEEEYLLISESDVLAIIK